MKIRKLKCPKCGRNRLEEVIAGASQSTPIEGVDGDGLLVYGDGTEEGAEVDRFQCAACGEVIRDGRGAKVVSAEGLVAWMQGRGKRRKGAKPT